MLLWKKISKDDLVLTCGGIFGNLNLLDFFIFIRNFRDNVYLTPPGTQKELRKKIVRVCHKKPRNFFWMQRWAFLEGIDSVCNSIEEILSN
jgi:hypothetical protein